MELNGPGSHGELLGLYFPGGRQHLDHHTNQLHKAPNATSDLLYKGALKDNKGNIVVPEGEKMTQNDLDQFPPGAPGLECKYCMYWWADGVTAELPSK